MNDHDPKIIEKLIQLNTHLQENYKPTEADREFVLTCLNDKDPVTRYTACTLSTEMDKAMTKKLIHHFNTFKPDVKKTLYLFLSTTEDSEAFFFLIDKLKTESSPDLIAIIEKGLSKTAYPILPIILNRLYTKNLTFSIRLQSVLKKIGFSKLELFLSLMPQIPHERLFRILFGDEKINHVKYK